MYTLEYRPQTQVIRCIIIQSIYSLAKTKAGNSSDSKTSRLKQLECGNGSSQPGNEEHSHPESRPYGLNQMRKKDNDQMMMMMIMMMMMMIMMMMIMMMMMMMMMIMMMMMMMMIHVYKAW